MNNSYHVEKRNEALYNSFKKVLRENPALSEDEAITIALKDRQPCLWVSFFGVYRIVLGLKKGMGKEQKNRSRKTVVDIVRKKYNRLKDSQAFRKASCLFLTSFIIAEPENGFFISESYAKKIIWKMRKIKQAAWRKGKNT